MQAQLQQEVQEAAVQSMLVMVVLVVVLVRTALVAQTGHLVPLPVLQVLEAQAVFVATIK